MMFFAALGWDMPLCRLVIRFRRFDKCSALKMTHYIREMKNKNRHFIDGKILFVYSLLPACCS